MGLRVPATFFIFIIFSMMALPPLHACGYCSPPSGRLRPPKTKHPPQHGKGHPPKVSPPSHHKPPKRPPVILPPIIVTPPVTNPPVTIPPPSSTYPPYNPPSGGGGVLPPGGGVTPPGGGGITPPGGGVPGISPPPSTSPTCPLSALKLGLCVDVLSGLVHIGIGNPVENACCPVIQGLLELEAAICLCTTIRLKLLNLNIILPIALQALITCGKNPPPGFVCPPLN